MKLYLHSKCRFHTLTASLGLTSVVSFFVAFALFSMLTPDFDWMNDYISELGAQEKTYALGWNLTGFVFVGAIFAIFGWCFGTCVNDPIFGICLIICGAGFALGSIPTDMTESESALSKVHFASICVSLAGWCFALARMSHIGGPKSWLRTSANVVVAVSVLPFVGVALGRCSEPIAHRLILITIFGWIVAVSIRLLRMNGMGSRKY